MVTDEVGDVSIQYTFFLPGRAPRAFIFSSPTHTPRLPTKVENTTLLHVASFSLEAQESLYVAQIPKVKSALASPVPHLARPPPHPI